MGYIRIEKKALDYVKTDFENLVFHIIDEDICQIEFSFSEDELITINEIKLQPLYKEGQNHYDLMLNVAKRKFSQISQILKEKLIDPINCNNLLFMALYIKAGLDCTPEYLYLDNARKINIANLFTAKRISRGNIDNVEIIIKSEDGTTATFNNLQWMHPLLENVMNAMTSSLQLSGSDVAGIPLLELLNNPLTSNSKLKSIANEYNKKVIDHREYYILKGADTLIRFLNDNNLLINQRARLGSKRQLELIYDVFEVLGLVTPKIEVDGDHIKNYREKIRDTLYK
ncbi:hypothetical protein [Mucilaginibacter sp.]|uniref:hypothetical protein n=1 Tax=Mucilaginibacter sp. TaxID=1882438 RepID=UPI0025FCB3EE|nr:hypothetical protein [Mucilaginibacter sp.]